MSTFFISYRRSTALLQARALYECLTREFGVNSTYLDLDKTPHGEDFLQVIKSQILTCDAVLIVIDKAWLGQRNSDGRYRICDVSDVVRAEIQTAIDHRKSIFPVLIDDAAMPLPSDLPDDVRKITSINAPRILFSHFGETVQPLLKTLRSVRTSNRHQRFEQRSESAIYYGAHLLGAIGALSWVIRPILWPDDYSFSWQTWVALGLAVALIRNIFKGEH